MDVDLELRQVRRNNDFIHHTYQWIPSHITEDESEDPYATTLNIQADALATFACKEVHQGQLQCVYPCLFSGFRAGCYISDSMVNNKLYEQLQIHNQKNTLTSYLREKYNWSQEVCRGICWEGHHKALNRLSPLQMVSVAKYIHQWQHTNRRRVQWKRDVVAKCAMCNEQEDKMYLLQCQSPLMFQKVEKIGCCHQRNSNILQIHG